MYKYDIALGRSGQSTRTLQTNPSSLLLEPVLLHPHTKEMDSFFTIAAPIPSEQTEVPTNAEKGTGSGQNSNCVIA